MLKLTYIPRPYLPIQESGLLCSSFLLTPYHLILFMTFTRVLCLLRG